MALPPAVAGLLGDEAGELLTALGQPAPVSIRLNPAKPVEMAGSPVPWCSQGRYLPERPVFTLDPFLHAGAYYVQEAGSMVLECAVKACGLLPDGAVALDLCAAPGGKATHLAALLPGSALLVANETDPARQAVLTENVWKWGRPDTVLTQAAPEDFEALGAFCELVLVDAPCSGEGMFRKDPHARAQWGENLVETCAARQQRILESAWHLVKPGGHLIYSTCTWEVRENEDQVQRLVDRGAVPVTIPVEEAWGMLPATAGVRCYPHRVRGEGFFIALLHKPGRGPGEAIGRLGPHPGNGTDQLPGEVVPWVRGAETCAAIRREDVLYAVEARWEGRVRTLMAALRTTAPGTPVARHKGGAWWPHPALALGGRCDHRAFAALDLDRARALAYLRGEALPGTDTDGFALVRHGGMGLGWAKGAGKRWNNLWPAAWRIRMR